MDGSIALRDPIKFADLGIVVPAGTLFRELSREEVESATFSTLVCDPQASFTTTTTTTTVTTQDSPNESSSVDDINIRNQRNPQKDDLIDSNELDGVHSFLEQQMRGSCLFDDYEQQYLSNFLDGFLHEPPPLMFADALPDASKITFERPVVFKQPPAQNIPAQSSSTVMSASSSSTCITGTVPAPILAPRKKRHRSNERLTEEEKRANHIASEQKRRRNIRMGFQALTLLIPSLSNYSTSSELLSFSTTGDDSASKSSLGAPSKQHILTEAINFIGELTSENIQLSDSALRMQSLLAARDFNANNQHS